MLQSILTDFEPGKGLKDAYMTVMEDEHEEEVMSNRIKLRKYLQELSYYQNQSAQVSTLT